MKPKYVVWRYYQLQGIFTFRELVAWMLKNLPAEYHKEIMAARRGDSKHYNRAALNWIATNSEYCSLHRVYSACNVSLTNAE